MASALIPAPKPLGWAADWSPDGGGSDEAGEKVGPELADLVPGALQFAVFTVHSEAPYQTVK